MSKESYIRGFCKAAEARGVDPQALAKFAASTEKKSEQDAGIGRYVDNATDVTYSLPGGRIISEPSDPKKDSYIGRLQAAGGEHANFGPTLIADLDQDSGTVSQKDLDWSRRRQAAANAEMFFTPESDPYRTLVESFKEQGRRNQKAFRETGYPVKRTTPDLEGIEKLKFTPEQLQWLTEMQNMQASAGNARLGRFA